MPLPLPNWSPPLQQDTSTGPVYFEYEPNIRYNVYSLAYDTTYTLQKDTFTLGNGSRDTDVSSAITNLRSTMIGVVPLIKILSTNEESNVTFSFPTNDYSISVITLERDYYVIPQANGSTGLYRIPGTNEVRLPYRHALIINGIYDSSGGYRPTILETKLFMEISQVGSESFSPKIINLPITLRKVNTNISLKPFTGSGAYSISDVKNTTVKGSSDYNNYIITIEYLEGSYDLSFSDFATTTRKNVNDGTNDYTNITYYISRSASGGTETIVTQNDYFTIIGSRILFRKVTFNANVYIPVPIKFFHEATSIYKRSIEYIGDYSNVSTIQLKIIKSTPTFTGQTPVHNTNDPSTIYFLKDLNKMTTEGSFVITKPVSTNSDSSDNFVISSSNESVVKIVYADGVFTARVYLEGVATITVTQLESTNFNRKIAFFNVNVFKITPAIINCNTNIFYTNPYNRAFWTRFTPNCRNSNLYNSITGAKLTSSEVDDVYDMRRKTEILKYNKNVGGLTKSQKYAKASRGELMRQIGNENKYLSQSSGAGGAGGFGPFTLVCPSTPESRSKLQCGLTTACGVPGKERLLCYDPSVNLYNYKKTYEYKAGLQITSNIPTTALSPPTNLTVTEFDFSNNHITLRWDAPDSNGGFPITGYVITYSKNNKTWEPYKSILPNGPTSGPNFSYNQISGELNGNSIIFEKIPGSIEITGNTIYYLSVFSGNERGLSSVPATITVKTSSVPSLIRDFSFNDVDRKNLMIDVKWTNPSNLGTDNGGYNGPPITTYNLYYRETTETTWSKQTIDISNVISLTSNVKRYILRNISNEKTYYLKIEPINFIGVGPESSILTARTLTKPKVPSNVIASARYAIPPNTQDASRNYISVNWTKPDDGGSLIKSYNITVTNMATNGISQTFTYTVDSTTIKNTTLTTNISRLTSDAGTGVIVDGSYSIVVSAFNGYLRSESSTASKVVILPTYSKPSISDVVGYYNQYGLSYARLIFTFNNSIAAGINVAKTIVNGLTTGGYEVLIDIYGIAINGSGEHIINIPATNAGNEYLIVGTTYNITLTTTYDSGESSTSEIFTYTPEIRFLT
jgi:hypothetical protein